MTLAADQQAMLGLLLEKGQTYSDLGTLLGIPEAEVRERARAALAAIGGADPDRRVGLTDYLLGQADPIGRADAVRHLRDDADDRALADRLIGELHTLAPGAELPKLPGEPRTAPHLRAPRVRRAEPAGVAPRIRSSLSQRQTRMIVGLGSGAIIIIVVVLAIAGVFSSSGSSAPASAGTASTPSSGGGSSGGGSASSARQLKTGQPVTLKAVGGSPAQGVAAFGSANGQQAFLDVRATGLPQISKNQVYSVWLMFSSTSGYPLGVISSLSSNGATHVQLPIPAAVIPPIQTSLQNIQVVVANRTELGKVVRSFVQGIKGKHPKIALHRPGSPVLVGAIRRTTKG